jgi:hypothetical protein
MLLKGFIFAEKDGVRVYSRLAGSFTENGKNLIPGFLL